MQVIIFKKIYNGPEHFYYAPDIFKKENFIIYKHL